ncbi:MAG: hypothetical protein WBQ23_17075 [Bacteroidota bacterium]
MLRRIFLFSLVSFLLAAGNAAFAQGIMAEIPKNIDVTARYVFYLPDAVVTPGNPQPVHEEFGEYQYAEIVNRFVAAGFVVITQPREATSHPYLEADAIVKQIRQLLAEGVPAASIGIVGARQGAAIAVIITYKMEVAGLQVVLLSACNEQFIEFWKQQNELLAGNVLSIYVTSDTERGPCLPFLEYCAKSTVQLYREIALPASAGNGYFYKGTAIWMLPSIAWLRGEHDAVDENGLIPPNVQRPK